MGKKIERIYVTQAMNEWKNQRFFGQNSIFTQSNSVRAVLVIF